MIPDLQLEVELSSTLRQLNGQIEVIFDRARTAMCNPYDMKYADGKLVLAPLLIAKSEVLKGMVDLRRMAKE